MNGRRRSIPELMGSTLLALLLCAATSARAELAAEEIELKVGIAEQRDEMVALLAELVRLNTGSWNREGLEQMADLLVPLFEELDFAVTLEPGVPLDLPGLEHPHTGPLVIARRAAPDETGDPPTILLVGHFDTVFERDSPFQDFVFDEVEPELPAAAEMAEEDQVEVDPAPPERPARATGPGAVDMKGGLVVMLHALRALREAGMLERASWVVLLNSDEEIGSLGSREWIEEEAGDADYGFVFEAAHGGGGMVRSRRGLGQFYMSVQGVSAHSGSAHDKGRSAVRELAEKVLLIESLTDYGRGVTLNVGTIEGGTKRNIVPEHAAAWIDLRYDEPKLGEQARLELERISGDASVDGTETTLWGTLHRPPKLATPQVDFLLSTHATVASDLGISLPDPVHAGGGTDGSLMGAVGLPTLDSMGVVGGGAHTTREYVELDSLADRAALAAILLRRIVHGKVPLPTTEEPTTSAD
jgi:glutamate carboxypeptidase